MSQNIEDLFVCFPASATLLGAKEEQGEHPVGKQTWEDEAALHAQPHSEEYLQGVPGGAETVHVHASHRAGRLQGDPRGYRRGHERIQPARQPRAGARHHQN